MKKWIPAVLYALGNGLVIYILNVLYPTSIVLGNRWISTFGAVTWFAVLITLIDYGAKKALVKKLNLKGRFPLMVFYFAVSTVAIWVLARIPDVSGFGIVRFYWAIILGFFLTLVQWSVRQLLKAIRAL